MNAICLTFDRLHIGHVGAYGNSWIETPAMDRLATEAFTFDHALIDSPRLELLYRSYWHGWHGLCAKQAPEDRPSLAALLRRSGVTTALLTDDRVVAEHPLAVDFDELIEIDPPWEARSAEEVEQTHFAKCFVQAIEWLEAARKPFLLWCHLGGLGTSWDAPPEFRRRYWEEGDPEPTDSAEVPEITLAADDDPDKVLSVVQAYAGQVSLLDTCLGAMLEFLEGSSAGLETLLTLSSSRGFPLGEHRGIGAGNESLYAELVHVPLMVRLPDGQGAAVRSQALVEPGDLWATLLDWWKVDDLPPAPSALSLMPIICGDAVELHDRLCLTGVGSERAIRTPAWYFRNAAGGELFAKPDDCWEINNVADRCHEVVECLEDLIVQYEQALYSGSTSDLPPLSDVLASGLD